MSFVETSKENRLISPEISLWILLPFDCGCQFFLFSSRLFRLLLLISSVRITMWLLKIRLLARKKHIFSVFKPERGTVEVKPRKCKEIHFFSLISFKATKYSRFTADFRTLLWKGHYAYNAKSPSWIDTWLQTRTFPWWVGGSKFCLRFSVRCAFCLRRLATVSTHVPF